MNSAAKLRTRGIAVIGATALIATAFGPAAMAWEAVPGTSDAFNKAGIASLGVIDTNLKKAGTQGAQVVSAGANDQLMGEIRFVIPSTFKKGDYVDFAVGAAAPATAAARVSWSGVPAVNIDSKAYAASTHVNATSDLPGTPVEGSTEDHAEKTYTIPTGWATPVSPQFDVTLVSSGGVNYNNVVRITFKNDSDLAAKDAKFIGSINSPKVNVGKDVTGALPVTATAASAGGGAATIFTTGDAGATLKNVTYPATVASVRMEVEHGGVIADDTYQYVGPITVTTANPKFAANDDVQVTISDGSFDTAAKGTAVWYDAAGKEIGKTENLSPSSATVLKAAAPATGDAYKVVFSGFTAKVAVGQQTVTYTLTGAAGVTLPTVGANLGSSAARNQTDIKTDDALVATTVATSAQLVRIAGTNRYETAVEAAKKYVGQSGRDAKGEADSIVIASGTGFADALSAAYLAATKEAPLLLVQPNWVPDTTSNFMQNYGVKNVYIVGGNAAVSAGVENNLKERNAYDVQAKATGSAEIKTTVYQADLGTPTLTDDPSTTPSGSVTYKDGSSIKDLNAAVTTEKLTVKLTRDEIAPTVSVSGAITTNTKWSATTSVAAGSSAATEVTLKLQGQDIVLKVPAASTTTSVQTFELQATGSEKVTTKPDTTATGDEKTVTGTDRQVVKLATSLNVVRLAGANRYETNRVVNEYAAATSAYDVGVTTPVYGQAGKRTAILATGTKPWDALAAGPLVRSKSNALPVILTGTGDKMDNNAVAQMARFNIGHVIIAGGPGVVSNGVVDQLKGAGASSTRLVADGAKMKDDRWGTGYSIAEFATRASGASATNTQPGFGLSGKPYLVNGGVVNGIPDANKWADALAVGPLAAKEGRVIVLTDSASLPETTKKLLADLKLELGRPVTSVGGIDAVSNATAAAANDILK